MTLKPDSAHGTLLGACWTNLAIVPLLQPALLCPLVSKSLLVSVVSVSATQDVAIGCMVSLVWEDSTLLTDEPSTNPVEAYVRHPCGTLGLWCP